jgi:hypothetical protein
MSTQLAPSTAALVLTNDVPATINDLIAAAVAACAVIRTTEIACISPR